MFVAILEVYPSATGKAQLLSLMRRLLELINEQSGLVSVERFQSLLDQHHGHAAQNRKAYA